MPTRYGSPDATMRTLPHRQPPVNRSMQGERGDSNPRPPGPQPGALPAELRPPRDGQCSGRLMTRTWGNAARMADLTARDAVLVKYLNEAYGKEKQLETVLQAQIGRTQNMTIKKRLREHLKETKAHARGVSSRIKALCGKAEASSAPGPEAVGDDVSAVTSLANKAAAA